MCLQISRSSTLDKLENNQGLRVDLSPAVAFLGGEKKNQNRRIFAERCELRI